MPDSPSDRIYSEEEIGRLLKRAAELQGKSGGRPTLGLTLPELQQLARESDIDPSFIEAAALELAGADTEDESGFFGGPLTLTIRRRIQGKVSEDTFNRMVSEARRRFKRTGTTSAVGSTREWATETVHDQSASFSLRERDGHTEMELFWTESEILPIPFVTTPIVASLIAIPIVGEELHLPPVWAVFTVLLWALTMAFTSRTVFRAVTARHRRRAREFGDLLVEIADQERHRTVEEARSGAEADRARPRDHGPRLELDEPESPPEQSEGPVPGRSRTV